MCAQRKTRISRSRFFTYFITLYGFRITQYDTIRLPSAQLPKAVCIHIIHFPCFYPSHSTFYCRICTNIFGFDWYYGSKLSGKWNIIAVSMKKKELYTSEIRAIFIVQYYIYHARRTHDCEWITENPSRNLADQVLYEFSLFYSISSNRCPFCLDVRRLPE